MRKFLLTLALAVAAVPSMLADYPTIYGVCGNTGYSHTTGRVG